MLTDEEMKTIIKNAKDELIKKQGTINNEMLDIIADTSAFMAAYVIREYEKLKESKS